jgi:hypothetical protein
VRRRDSNPQFSTFPVSNRRVLCLFNYAGFSAGLSRLVTPSGVRRPLAGLWSEAPGYAPG